MLGRGTSYAGWDSIPIWSRMTDQTPARTRVFLDANVLYAASINPEGGSSRLWTLPDVVLLSCEQATVEAWTNLGTERARAKINADTCRARLAALLAAVEICASDADRSSYLFCPWPLKDPDDVGILMGAISSGCRFLLTLDSDCFGAYYGQSVGGVVVLQPGRFLQQMGLPKQ